MIWDMALNHVKILKYLESKVQSDGRCIDDIKHRVRYTKITIYFLYNINKNNIEEFNKELCKCCTVWIQDLDC